MLRSLALGTAAVLALLGGVPASAAPALAPVGTYSVGAAVESLNPSQAILDTGTFFLGGFGLSNGQVAGQQTPLTGRAATHILGDSAHVRAFVVSDGTHAIALAQLEVQCCFAAYKQGNAFGSLAGADGEGPAAPGVG
jgi:hypothetical protein